MGSGKCPDQSGNASKGAQKQGQQQGKGKGSFDPKQVQLQPAASSTEEEERRRHQVMDALLSKVEAYALQLFEKGQEQKVSVLARIALPDLQELLQQPKPDRLLDRVYEHHKRQQQQADNSSSTLQQPQQQAEDSKQRIVRPLDLPPHVAKDFEAALPVDSLPVDWHSFSSWCELELKYVEFMKSINARIGERRVQFRKQRLWAQSAAAQARMADDLRQQGWQGAVVRERQPQQQAVEQQQPPQQQQSQQQLQHEGPDRLPAVVVADDSWPALHHPHPQQQAEPGGDDTGSHDLPTSNGVHPPAEQPRQPSSPGRDGGATPYKQQPQQDLPQWGQQQWEQQQQHMAQFQAMQQSVLMAGPLPPDMPLPPGPPLLPPGLTHPPLAGQHLPPPGALQHPQQQHHMMPLHVMPQPHMLAAPVPHMQMQLPPALADMAQQQQQVQPQKAGPNMLSPKAAALFEQSLPAGMLPPHWQGFASWADMTKYVKYTVGGPAAVQDNMRRFKEAKLLAQAMTAADMHQHTPMHSQPPHVVQHQHQQHQVGDTGAPLAAPAAVYTQAPPQAVTFDMLRAAAGAAAGEQPKPVGLAAPGTTATAAEGAGTAGASDDEDFGEMLGLLGV